MQTSRDLGRRLTSVAHGVGNADREARGRPVPFPAGVPGTNRLEKAGTPPQHVPVLIITSEKEKSLLMSQDSRGSPNYSLLPFLKIIIKKFFSLLLSACKALIFPQPRLNLCPGCESPGPPAFSVPVAPSHRIRSCLQPYTVAGQVPPPRLPGKNTMWAAISSCRAFQPEMEIP